MSEQRKKDMQDLGAGLIHQIARPLAETEPRLNYSNPDVLRSGLIHLRHRIDENLEVPHYRDYHLEVIDAALQLVDPELVVQLRYVARSCPCGARSESPRTHPHVGGCPIAKIVGSAHGLCVSQYGKEGMKNDPDEAVFCACGGAWFGSHNPIGRAHVSRENCQRLTHEEFKAKFRCNCDYCEGRIGSGNQPAKAKPSDATRRSEAPKC